MTPPTAQQPFLSPFPYLFAVDQNSELDPSIDRPSKAFFFLGDCVGHFGKIERERSAGKLAIFLRDGMGDRWAAFKLSQLVKFYAAQGWNSDEAFFGLTGLWFDDSMYHQITGNPWVPSESYLAFTPTGEIKVTMAFIERCCAPNPGWPKSSNE